MQLLHRLHILAAPALRFAGALETPEGGITMNYWISYDDGTPISVKKWRDQDIARTEEFRTEHEALNRARELLDGGDCQTVVLSDSSGGTLSGVRLQLKLGYSENNAG